MANALLVYVRNHVNTPDIVAELKAAFDAATADNEFSIMIAHPQLFANGDSQPPPDYCAELDTDHSQFFTYALRLKGKDRTGVRCPVRSSPPAPRTPPPAHRTPHTPARLMAPGGLSSLTPAPDGNAVPRLIHPEARKAGPRGLRGRRKGASLTSMAALRRVPGLLSRGNRNCPSRQGATECLATSRERVLKSAARPHSHCLGHTPMCVRGTRFLPARPPLHRNDVIGCWD